jgi:HPt (histidine-containing phosphotransfer) domain-containing protein
MSQTKHLNTVLATLENIFENSPDQVRNMIGLLRTSVSSSLSAFESTAVRNIKTEAHRLTSELRMCGHTILADKTKAIEQQASAGNIDQILIQKYSAEAILFVAEMDEWLAHSEAISGDS